MQPIPSIREECAEDIPGVRKVIHAAFGRSGEADLVDGRGTPAAPAQMKIPLAQMTLVKEAHQSGNLPPKDGE